MMRSYTIDRVRALLVGAIIGFTLLAILPLTGCGAMQELADQVIPEFACEVGASALVNVVCDSEAKRKDIKNACTDICVMSVSDALDKRDVIVGDAVVHMVCGDACSKIDDFDCEDVRKYRGDVIEACVDLVDGLAN